MIGSASLFRAGNPSKSEKGRVVVSHFGRPRTAPLDALVVGLECIDVMRTKVCHSGLGTKPLRAG